MGEKWGGNVRIVIAGLSNAYSGYITTWEEYQDQRFEAAATAFGPHTLDAYIQVHLLLLSHFLTPLLSLLRWGVPGGRGST